MAHCSSLLRMSLWKRRGEINKTTGRWTEWVSGIQITIPRHSKTRYSKSNVSEDSRELRLQLQPLLLGLLVPMGLIIEQSFLLKQGPELQATWLQFSTSL